MILHEIFDVDELSLLLNVMMIINCYLFSMAFITKLLKGIFWYFMLII